MQPAENFQPNEPEVPVSHAQTQPDTQTPLLGQEQIAKLQTILRSMDQGQLKSVLSAIEPNVLRLCLHAIFSPQESVQPSSTGVDESEPGPETSPSQDAATLTQSGRETPAPHDTPDEPAQAGTPATGGVSVRGRASPRTSTQNNAKILSRSDNVCFDCLILDKSETGALVFLDYGGELPETFALYDLGDQKIDDDFIHLPHKTCSAVWRKRNKMGVTFIDA